MQLNIICTKLVNLLGTNLPLNCHQYSDDCQKHCFRSRCVQQYSTTEDSVTNTDKYLKTFGK